MIRILGMCPKKSEAKDDSLSTMKDIVQGLSGNHLTSFEDNLLFEEGQATQTDKQLVGMVQKSNSGLRK
jgi:hypothetical protein